MVPAMNEPGSGPDAESPPLRLGTVDASALFRMLAEESTASIGGTPAPTGSAPWESAGDCIGPYRLMEQLGEGGFGIVWRAEQQVPLRREVAIKVVKPGMDSREVVARFEVERQTLALMAHPGIASVLDAGTTPAGRPYFVMELVHGRPITSYCQGHHLDVRARLELFLPVCEAVQHAHQKAILHRDLKPSNILITEINGRPVAKVIDFGIAKALGTGASLPLTREHSVIGTPMYMSPEQAGARRDVDTRSDIYALGAILYELLAGEPPLSPSRLGDTSWDEVLKLIREQEPVRPSTRVSERSTPISAVGAHAVTIDARKIRSQIRGDLDWICLKALEKDRERRYPTAVALGEDIRAHLQAVPVNARPPTVGYRFGRWLRRNRLLAVSIGTVAMAVLAASVVASIYYFRERDALAREKQSSKKLAAELQEQVYLQNFLTLMVDDFEEDKVLARKVFEKALIRARREASVKSAEATALIMLTLARLVPQTGDRREGARIAEESLQQQEDRGQRLGALEAGALLDYTRLLTAGENPALARRVATVALQKTRALEEPEKMPYALAVYADACDFANDLDGAVTALKEACEIRRELNRRSPPRGTGGPFRSLALALERQGHYPEALQYAKEQMENDDRFLGAGAVHPSQVANRELLARLLEKSGDAIGAEAVRKEILRMKGSGADMARSHPAMAGLNTADRLLAQDRLDEAMVAYDSVLEGLETSDAKDQLGLSRCHRGRAGIFAKRRQWRDASNSLDKAMTAARMTNSPVEEILAAAVMLEVLRDSGHPETGETLLLENPAWTAMPKVPPAVLLRLLRPAQQILQLLNSKSPSRTREAQLKTVTGQITRAEESLKSLPAPPAKPGPPVAPVEKPEAR